MKTLTQQDLRDRLNRLARNERKITAAVVEHLAEVLRRRLFADWGFSSLFEYVKLELGYSESAAWRRVEAARALLAVPEIKADLETGALHLSQIVLAQKAIKNEQKNSPMTLAEKKEIFAEIRNKSGAETQKILDRDFDIPQAPIERHKRDDSVELTVRLPKEVFDNLLRIKELYSHSIPSGNWVEVISAMADDVIKKRDPLAKKAVEEKAVEEIEEKHSKSPGSITSPQSATATEVPSLNSSPLAPSANTSLPISAMPAGPLGRKHDNRPVRAQVRRYIFQRDRCCQFKKADGSICGSRYQLELDHITPQFAGGSHDVANLRVLCRFHNQERYRKGANLSFDG